VRDSSTDWRGLIAAKPHTAIGDLVAGLDEVATLRIPYGQLPRRAHSAYSPDFTRWSDIVDQTPTTLLHRPKAGVATVSAVLTAAQDAVAAQRSAATASPVDADTAVQRLLGQLDDRDLALLSARVWAAQPPSQRTLADQLNVNVAWVQRNQPRVETRFAEFLADPVHRQVREYAAALCRHIGPFAPVSVVDAELRSINVDPHSQTAQVLLHLAGPYAQRDEWWENTAVAGQQQAAAAVDTVLDSCPAPSGASLVEALSTLGMTVDVATAYLDTRSALRRFGDTYVRWGHSAADKAEAVLHARGTPAAPEEIHDAMGTDSTTTLRALHEALYAGHRFIRTSRLTWGLRAWGSQEYSGIFDEIAACIDAAPGGEMGVDELIADLLSRFPDVAEGSIKAFLNALAFVVDGSTVRRRTEADGWPPVPPLNRARGAFRNGDNEIRLAIEVTSEVLRGSGQPLHPAVATAIGVNPGQRQPFSSPQGPVAVTWRLSSTNGPSIGSLRAQAKATSAALGDTLVLAFRPNDESVDVARIGAEITGLERLRHLLGRTVRSPAAALTASMDSTRADVATALRDRGDTDLADLVDR